MYSPQSNLMSEQTYFILASLLDGPLHGYAIVSAADELSDGRIRLVAGTLYGALERLRKQGMVEAEREETVNGRRRRYYRITASGVSVVSEETERMRSAAGSVAPLLGRTHRAGDPTGA